VLSIGKIVAGSQEHYIRTVAAGREEYYTGSGESPGYWVVEGHGASASRAKLQPTISASFLAGVSPQGEIRTAGRVAEAKRVTGFDLTWSAPKSVSLLYGHSEPR
jgi:hypothetical protein